MYSGIALYTQDSQKIAKLSSGIQMILIEISIEFTHKKEQIQATELQHAVNKLRYCVSWFKPFKRPKSSYIKTLPTSRSITQPYNGVVGCCDWIHCI